AIINSSLVIINQAERAMSSILSELDEKYKEHQQQIDEHKKDSTNDEPDLSSNSSDGNFSLELFREDEILEKITKMNFTKMHTTYKLNTNLSLSEIRPNSNVKVIIIVLSSWTESGYMKRQSFRDTSVKLIPQNSKDLSITYRFVLGDVPSAKLQLNMGHKLLDESKRYARELEESGPDKKYYWRDLDIENKYADFDYKLPIFPPFTAGILYILSSDIISLIVIDAPHILQGTMDDQSMRMLSITEGYVKDLDKGFVRRAIPAGEEKII
ncbi:16759_t:CDS:2, partial [Funneliformis geosporum]